MMRRKVSSVVGLMKFARLVGEKFQDRKKGHEALRKNSNACKKHFDHRSLFEYKEGNERTAVT